MSAEIIDGKAIAARVRGEVKAEADALKARGVQPGLAVVLVGEDPASQVYVRNKSKAAAEAGIATFDHKLGADTSEADLLALVRELNSDARVDGILVQFPVPKQIAQKRVIDTISIDKDVDGLHPANLGHLWAGDPRFIACTPNGCMRLLAESQTTVAGADAVVIGRSNIVGKPISIMLSNDFEIGNATVTLTHIETPRELLVEETRRADIVIVAVGIPGFVTPDMVKEGATVIDVGINRLESGRIVGDVDFAAVAPKCSWITPVPGGVGRMTVAALMVNTMMAYQSNFQLNLNAGEPERAAA
jgi:methylenetetrahydrofolate dehydrogenase (NADP+) / methenyltetrahydrofolate cyclohydrolase